MQLQLQTQQCPNGCSGFGDEHLRQVFAAQLKTRIQKVGESLQEFEADVKKMVQLAYAEAPPTIQERLATETFKMAFATLELRRSYNHQGIRHHLMP